MANGSSNFATMCAQAASTGGVSVEQWSPAESVCLTAQTTAQLQGHTGGGHRPVQSGGLADGHKANVSCCS